MARLLDVDDLIAELEAACMPIYDKSLSGITGSTDTIADIINECAKEKEPALSANSTSSEVSDDTCSILQFDDSIKERICQEAEKAYKACELILEIYERMDDSEQKAFNLGQSYRAMVEVKEELTRIGNGGDGK